MDLPTSAATNTKLSEELVKLQPKGLITIPKKFRDSLGMVENSMVKVKKEPLRLVIEPVRVLPYPVRSYSDSDLQTFFELDKKETKKLKEKRLSAR